MVLTIFMVSIVQVSICNLFGVSFSKFWSWNRSLYTEAGMMSISAQVSVLLSSKDSYFHASSNYMEDLLPSIPVSCQLGLCLYMFDLQLETEWVVWALWFWLAVISLNCACSQLMCPWFVAIVVSLFLLTFHKAQACEVPKCMTALALILIAWHVKPSKWVESPHLLLLSFCLYALLGSKDFLL